MSAQQDHQELNVELDRAGMRALQNNFAFQLKSKIWALAVVLIVAGAASASYFLDKPTRLNVLALMFSLVTAGLLLVSILKTSATLFASHHIEGFYRKRETAGRSNRPFTTLATLGAFAMLAIFLKPIWLALWQEGFAGMHDKGWLPATAMLCAALGYAVYATKASTRKTMHRETMHSADLEFGSPEEAQAFTADHEAKTSKKLLLLWALTLAAPLLGLLFIAMSG